jgi:hypothetical protein
MISLGVTQLPGSIEFANSGSRILHHAISGAWTHSASAWHSAFRGSSDRRHPRLLNPRSARTGRCDIMGHSRRIDHDGLRGNDF